ncbi:hypothetical protein [Pseudobdellovibrio exovorus]|uniref:Uncharacterized protein n=1 Tax=Pseudobdellovibrio exovorus JSS TaxID=1184267 RepID=M4VDA6_9BACT|nr:hypothetical protein [Pseudobdellovibrio exovorus]AGH95996.1 hypothetical protein A11Q_1780 [Pseudobdellovibrio exovorus JSS]
MKKFILATLVVVFSFSAFAQSPSEVNLDEDYATKAFEILNENIDDMRGYTADGREVNLKAALEDAGEYILHIFSHIPLLGDMDDEEYTGNVKDLKFDCNERIAKCSLLVMYKSGNIKERQISFKVNVENKMPTSIVGNKILIVDRK